MSKYTIIFAAIAGLVFALAPVASAQPVYNFFWADMNAETNTIDGSGHIAGEPMYQDEFFEYPQGPDPTWSNAWFFNSPEIKGSKWIEYLIELTPGENETIIAEVAINWSNQLWTDIIRPPTDPSEDSFIVRQTIWNGPVPQGLVLDNRGDPIIIPDFNPIWVSYDIRVLDYAGTLPFMGGDVQLWHEHIPEPATMSLMALGGLALLRRKRRA